jgi:hypothetical protein
MRPFSIVLRKFLTLFLTAFISLISLKTTLAQNCPGVTATITNGSVVNLCAGASLVLNAQTGAGYNYQWQKQTSVGGPFADLTGETNSNYTVLSEGAFRVIVGNGSCSDTSTITNVVTINLSGGTISGDVSIPVCKGAPGGTYSSLPVEGYVLGFVTFQWETKTGSGNWTPVTDATGLKFTLGNIFETTSVRRIAYDKCGNSASSNEIIISLFDPVIAGSISPATQTISAGQSPSLFSSTASATGGDGHYTYKWQSAPASNGPWGDISSTNNENYQNGPISITTYFRRVAIDGCGFIKATSEIEVIVSNPILYGGLINQTAACVFPGNLPSLITSVIPANGGVAPYTYQWQLDNGSGWTDIPGANSLTLSPPAITANTSYRRKVTDNIGTEAFSNLALYNYITTNLNPGTLSVISNLVCLGSSPSLIVATTPTGFGSLQAFFWQKRTESGSWQTISGATQGDYQPEPISEKTYFRKGVIDACGAIERTEYTNEIIFEMRPELLGGDLTPATQNIVSGGTPVQISNLVSPSGGTGFYKYSWQQADLAVGPWTEFGNNSLDYQPPALNQTTYFRRKVTDLNCLAIKYSYAVEVVTTTACAPVDPGVLTATSLSTCAGNNPGLITGTAASGVGLGVIYQWERKLTGGSWSNIPGANSLDLDPGVLSADTYFRRKVTDICNNVTREEYSNEIFITISGSSSLTGGTISNGSNACMSLGVSPGLITGTSAGTGVSYQWEMMLGTNGTWANIPGATNQNYTPSALSGTTCFRRKATNGCGNSEYSNVLTFSVVSKLDGGIIDAIVATCVGTSPGTILNVLAPCNGSKDYTFEWEANNGFGWNPIPGSNSLTYTPPAINFNTTYRRKVIDACGSIEYSNEVTVLIYPPIKPGNIGPALQLVCGGVTPQPLKSLSDCYYSVNGVSYQWQIADDCNGPWTDIAGATSSTYQPDAGYATKHYRLKVTGLPCGNVQYTNTAEIGIGGYGCRVADTGGQVELNSNNSLNSFTVPNNKVDHNNLLVYPNPIISTNKTIRVTLKNNETITFISVQNIDGRLNNCTIKSKTAFQTEVVLPSSISSGTYVLIVQTKKGIYSKSIVVQ